MTEERKRHYFLKLWELVDEVILAGALFPLVKGLAVKGAEKLGKKVEEKLGFGSLEDAKKSVEDNILYGSACLNGLNSAEISELKNFEKKLKQEENGRDKVQALVLYVVKGIVFFKAETTKTRGKSTNGSNTSGSKSNEPKETTKKMDYSEGAAWAVKFLRQLLNHPSFEERVAFLEHEEVFSLIQKKKETIDLIGKARDFFGKAIDAAEVVSQKGSNGIEDVNNKLDSLIEKARKWRDG